MKNMQFLRGVGIGIIAGTAIGLAVTPKTPTVKSKAGRAIRAVGDVVENISDAMGL